MTSQHATAKELWQLHKKLDKLHRPTCKHSNLLTGAMTFLYGNPITRQAVRTDPPHTHCHKVERQILRLESKFHKKHQLALKVCTDAITRIIISVFFKV